MTNVTLHNEEWGQNPRLQGVQLTAEPEPLAQSFLSHSIAALVAKPLQWTE